MSKIFETVFCFRGIFALKEYKNDDCESILQEAILAVQNIQKRIAHIFIATVAVSQLFSLYFF